MDHQEKKYQEGAMDDGMTPRQKESFEGFVRDFPPGQCVRYLPTNGVMGAVKEVYWSDVFFETWVEVDVWDVAVPDFRPSYHLPALLFRRQESDYCAKKKDTREKSANT